MNIPSLKLSGISSATTYRFNCGPEDLGWAFCTVNDATGELNIQSDWGSWAYGWSPSPKHLGSPTLTDFIATRSSARYIADKLWGAEGGTSYGGGVFSPDATIKAMRKTLAERRLKEGRMHARSYTDITWNRRSNWGGGGVPLTKTIAREVWDALDDLNDRHMTEDLFGERFYQIDYHQWITESISEHLETEVSGKYLVLRDGIIPALIAACQEHLATRPHAVAELEAHAHG